MSDNYQEQIEALLPNYPICEYYFLTQKDLIFSDKVRYICEHECEHYGHSWACPPAIAPISDCMDECSRYQHVFLFTTVAEVPDILNFDACLKARRDHGNITLKLREEFRAMFGDVLALSTGCMLCDKCTYPDEPCRHPDERLSTIESHGILIMKTANTLGISYDCGSDCVTYFSLIFFHAAP